MLLAAIAILTTAFRLRVLDVPLDRDEGEYAYFGQMLLQGIAPYAGAYNFKLPGIYAVFATILGVFGQTPAGVHLGLLAANLAGVASIFTLALRLLTPPAALAAGATFAVVSASSRVYGFNAYAEHFVLIPVLAGTIVLLTASGSNRLRWYFASGVLFGLAVLVKQSAAAFVLFAVLYALSCRGGVGAGGREARRFAPTVVLVGAALLPYAVTCAALGLLGVFERFWFWTVVYARHYALEHSFTEAFVALSSTMGEIVPGTFLVAVLAGVGVLALVRGEARQTRFLVLFLMGAIVATAAGLHFRRHYFLLLLPPVSLLTGLAVETIGRRLPWRDRWLRAAVLVLVVALPLAHVVYADRAILRARSPDAIARLLYGLNPFPEALTIAAYIRERTGDGDRVAVIGSEPQIYFYARRPAATGYVYMYPLMEAHPYAVAMQREMIAEIDAARPRFVVLVNASASWLARPGSDRTLFRWWETAQHAFERVGFADILDQGTTYVWGADAAGYVPRSLVWVAVFERRAR